MTAEEINALLAKPLDAVIAVPRPHTGPQLTVVWFYWDGEALYVSTTRDRAKYANIRRHPHISMLVNDQAAHTFVAAYGRAEVVDEDTDRIVELTKPILEKYMPGQADGQAALLRSEGRVVIVLRPDKIVTN